MIRIHLTEKAAKKIQELRKILNVPQDYALRIGAGQSGCGNSGTYQIGFDEIRKSDFRDTIQNIDIVVAPSEAIFVMGMKIDWQTIEDQEGFIFTDPGKEEK